MSKLGLIVAAVTAAAYGCTIAAESLAPKVEPIGTVPAATDAPMPTSSAKLRELPPYREPAGALTVTPAQQRAGGADVGWSVGDETNASRLAAAPLPNDVPAVQALHEQTRETLLALVRRQAGMQVTSSDQLKRVRDYRTKLRTENPELLELQQQLMTNNSDRADLSRQIEERLAKDAQYQKLTQQRVDDLKQLRDMGALTGALRDKMAQLKQRQAELERQAALAATNQAQSVAPAVIINSNISANSEQRTVKSEE